MIFADKSFIYAHSWYTHLDKIVLANIKVRLALNYFIFRNVASNISRFACDIFRAAA